MISGSDSHRVEDVGRGGIILQRPVKSIHDLVSMQKQEPMELIIAENGMNFYILDYNLFAGV